jgi:hypothetical protein
LKADLNKKSTELNEKLQEVSNRYAEARKLVKIELPQTAWKEFGIKDQR